MKKIFMMAIALMASTMTFAGDSDALKAIMKSKDYAEAAQLLKQNLAQLADNAEKAKAYNHLVDLAMNKVTNETGTIAENQLAAQMGSDKVKAYDTLGLADGICNAIENAIECNKYDQLPDAKGRVKPKFAEKNAARIWAVRPNLVNIGQTEAQKGNDAGVLKYWGAFTDAGDEPFFAACDHNAEKDYFGQVAFFAGRYAYQAGQMERANKYFEVGQMERANKYFEVAKRDPQQKADAVNFQLYAMRQSLKTKADSLAYINQLKQMYDKEPENDVILDGINAMYEGMKDKAAQAAFLDAHLAKFPNSFGCQVAPQGCCRQARQCSGMDLSGCLSERACSQCYRQCQCPEAVRRGHPGFRQGQGARPHQVAGQLGLQPLPGLLWPLWC